MSRNNKGYKIPWFIIFISFIFMRAGFNVYNKNQTRTAKIEEANREIEGMRFERAFKKAIENDDSSPKKSDPIYDFENDASEQILAQLDSFNVNNIDITIEGDKKQLGPLLRLVYSQHNDTLPLPEYKLSHCEKEAARLYAKAIMHYELDQFDKHHETLSSLYVCLANCDERKNIIDRHSLIVNKYALPRSKLEIKIDHYLDSVTSSFGLSHQFLINELKSRPSIENINLIPDSNVDQLHEFIEKRKGSKLYEELQLRRAHKGVISGSDIDRLLLARDFENDMVSLFPAFAFSDEPTLNTYKEHRQRIFKDSDLEEFIFDNTIVRPIKLKRIQNTLNSEQVIINYYLSDSTSYALVTSNKYSKLVQLPHSPKELTGLVFKLRKAIYSYWLNPNASDAEYFNNANVYSQDAYTLYKGLVKPLESYLKKELIIIPDGSLGYLPFESLLTRLPKDPTEFKSHDYFLRNHVVSYSFSSTLWREMCLKKHTNNNSLVAFAPNFNPYKSTDSTKLRSNISILKWNTKEAEKVANLFSGKVFIGLDATIENFHHYGQSSRIIHLATHAKSGNKGYDNFFVLAQDNLVTQIDIKRLDLQSDLVVLSACETGLGEIEKGEGVRSLSKAFAYTGAKSIMSTLWSVDDRKSYELMVQFYEELLHGQKKNVALRNAKLDLILQNSHRDAHPFFWSSYVIHGDMSPLK